MFITFEGGEGAGKSTLIRRMHKALVADSVKVRITREPGGTHLGEELRALLLEQKQTEPVAAKAELFLFLAARAQHIETVIRPAIAHGETVLCDRFSDSSIAYQGAQLGVEYVEACCKLVTQGFEPELTFYIDIDPRVGMSRVRKRGQGMQDRIEARAFAYHEQVRALFLDLAKRYPERIVCLDGTLDPETVFTVAYGRFLDARRK
jgi:dTMP kinase